MKSQSTALHEKISFLKKCKRALVSFAFPSYCLHCQQEEEGGHLLCSACLGLCELSSEAPLYRSAFCMEAVGPALSLIFAMKGPLKQEAAKSVAALMVFRLASLTWPMPDIIVFEKPYLFLARELAVLLNKPVLTTAQLKRRKKAYQDPICLAISLTSQEKLAGLENAYFLSFVD